MTPTCQFWWNWWVQLAVAIGTIGAVVVALFRDWFRVVLWPPKLSIELQDRLGEIANTEVTFQSGPTVVKLETVSRWYHIRVENRRHWSLAREVRLLLLGYEEPDSLGQWQTKWSGAIPLKWQHQGIKPLAPTMGQPDNCDLCSVLKMPTSTGRPHRLELHPLIRALSMPTQWETSHTFAVTLQARSLEARSKLIRVEIAWDGQWDDDATKMSHHLVVKQDEAT